MSGCRDQEDGGGEWRTGEEAAELRRRVPVFAAIAENEDRGRDGAVEKLSERALHGAAGRVVAAVGQLFQEDEGACAGRPCAVLARRGRRHAGCHEWQCWVGAGAVEKVAKGVELGLVGDPLLRVGRPVPELGAHGPVAPRDRRKPQVIGEYADGGGLSDPRGAAEDQKARRIRTPRPRPRRGPLQPIRNLRRGNQR